MTTEASPTAGGAPRRVALRDEHLRRRRRRGRDLPDRGGDPPRRHRRRRHLRRPAAARRAVLAAGLGRSPTAARTQVSFTASSCSRPWPSWARPGRASSASLVGPFDNGRAPMRARVFNSGMFATMGVVGGAAYIVRRWPARRTRGRRAPGRSCRQIGIPVLVADVVQFAVNLVLLAVVVRLAAGVLDAHPDGPDRQLVRLRTARLRRHRLHHGRALGAGAARARPACSSSSRRSSPPSGPTGSTPRRGRATSAPCTCWWPRSRPRLRTWPATAPGSPS